MIHVGPQVGGVREWYLIQSFLMRYDAYTGVYTLLQGPRFGGSGPHLMQLLWTKVEAHLSKERVPRPFRGAEITIWS